MQFKKEASKSRSKQEKNVHLESKATWSLFAASTPLKKGSRVSRPQPGCHYQTLSGRE